MPSTDEVWRLQSGKEEDAIMFQKIANEGHYKKEGSTRQGIYVCSPNGTLLSSINSLNPDAVLESIMRVLINGSSFLNLIDIFQINFLQKSPIAGKIAILRMDWC